MAVRTKRLYLGQPGGGTGVTTLYTTPSGETTIVKSLAFKGRIASVYNATLSIQLAGGGGTYAIMRWTAVPVAESRYEDVWIVLHPGDLLRWQVSVASAVELAVSGAELEGVAD